jgi:hypothetical protein
MVIIAEIPKRIHYLLTYLLSLRKPSAHGRSQPAHGAMGHGALLALQWGDPKVGRHVIWPGAMAGSILVNQYTLVDQYTAFHMPSGSKYYDVCHQTKHDATRGMLSLSR